MADLPLREFKPRSQLVTKQTPIQSPRYPVVDAHNHLDDQFGGGWIHRPVQELLDVLDQAHIIHLVDLDGGWGEDILERHLEHFKAAAPERFQVFGGVDWSKFPELGDRFGEWAAGRLEQQARRGAQGLKVWKNLGLNVRDQHDRLVAVDDPRLDPIWAKCAELKLPVVIHVADPAAFFDPIGPQNERIEELGAHPDWQFPSPPYPGFLSIVNALANVVCRHPETTFIGAHVGCYAENLTWVGDLLNQAPNFYVDIAARIAELGRQPFTARKFFQRYADRILFGTDLPANLGEYRIHYRFLETDDEYFDYSTAETPPQGRWMIYGLNLPDEVLKKVYSQNARRILFAS